MSKIIPGILEKEWALLKRKMRCDNTPFFSKIGETREGFGSLPLSSLVFFTNKMDNDMEYIFVAGVLVLVGILIFFFFLGYIVRERLFSDTKISCFESNKTYFNYQDKNSGGYPLQIEYCGEINQISELMKLK